MCGLDLKPRMPGLDRFLARLNEVKSSFYWDLWDGHIYAQANNLEDDRVYDPITTLSPDDPRDVASVLDMTYEEYDYLQEAIASDDCSYPEIRSRLLIDLGLGA